MEQPRHIDPDTVPARAMVRCPLRKGRHVSLKVCGACEYHGGIRKKIKHEFVPEKERTEPVEVGELVICRHPMRIPVEFLLEG